MTRLVFALLLLSPACTINVDDTDIGVDTIDPDTGTGASISACWDHVLCLDVSEICDEYFLVEYACEECSGQMGIGYPCDQPDLIGQCETIGELLATCQGSCDGEVEGVTETETALAWDYFVCNATSTDWAAECPTLRTDCQES